MSRLDLDATDPDRLRETLTAVLAENEALKSRLAEREGRGALKGCKEDVPVAATAGKPVFPVEIFPLIANYLDPGTTSLLELARTCRTLYELLLPRLYECFSTAEVSSKVRKALRSDASKSSLPHGLSLVRKLDAGLPSDAWEGKNRIDVACSCTNVGP